MKDTYTALLDGREVEMGTPELCDLIRSARMERGISLRELARRSGVSAGQLSRIESGEARLPSVKTLQAIADAFGRPVAPLLFLAGHINAEELEDRTDGLIDALLAAGEAGQALGVTSDEDAAQALWRHGDGELMAASVGGKVSVELMADISEIAAAWVSLTPERRRLALAFVADQEVLSTLDRMPTPPGRYTIDVSLGERERDDAED